MTTYTVPIRVFSCPNHPDGPVTLPADGDEREELRIEEAYGSDELVPLLTLVAEARRRGEPEVDHVERMLGLCCIGHTWRTVGYREQTTSEITVRQFSDILLGAYMPGLKYKPGILLAELERDRAGGGTVRIPLITPKPPDDHGNVRP